MDTLVFDIETEPFNEAFMNAKTRDTRLVNSPRMRVACVFDVEHGEYHFFTHDQASALVELIHGAKHMVSFNGSNFDLLVLERHYGLSPDRMTHVHHTDIHKIMSSRSGYRVSLHKAVQLNFGEKKKVDGRSMSELDIEKLKEACRSDVDQTYRLWQLEVKGTLKCPTKSVKDDFFDDYGGPGSFAPHICPACLDVASLVFIEMEPDEYDDMTEGQLAEYMAGTWGTVYCTSCGHYLDYEI